MPTFQLSNVHRFRCCVHKILRRWIALIAIDVHFVHCSLEYNYGTCIISLIFALGWTCMFYYALFDYKYAHIPSFHPMYSLCVVFAGFEVCFEYDFGVKTTYIVHFRLLQVVSKYYFMVKSTPFLHLLTFIESIYARNLPNSRVCTEYVQLTERIVKIAISIYIILVVHMDVIFQLVYNIIGGHFYPMMPFLIPGLNIDSFYGRCSALLLQSLVLTFGWATITAFHTMMMIIFVNVPMLSTILIEHIDQLERIQSVWRFRKGRVRQKLYQIIWMQRQFNE